MFVMRHPVMHHTSIFLLLSLFISCCYSDPVTVQEFRKLFIHKRGIQLEAVKSLLNLPKYEAKYAMVERMFGKIFELHNNAMKSVQDSDFIPGGEDLDADPPLPDDTRIMELLSSLMENCALVGDVVLRLPDISQRILKRNKEWMTCIEQCLTFCKMTRLLDPVTEEMFELAAQELNLVPRSDNFTNPYREEKHSTKPKRLNNRKMEL